MVKGAVTGEAVLQLTGIFAKSLNVQWDSWCLAIYYKFGEVLILDFNHMAHL